MLGERGISLTEAMTAATLSVIAVLGLAYSFGEGRALVDRYEIARAALGEAQSQLESMTLWSRTDAQLAFGYRSTPTPFLYEGVQRGTSQWVVTAVDDPVLTGTQDLKRVVVTVRWRQGSRADSLSLERLWLP